MSLLYWAWVSNKLGVPASRQLALHKLSYVQLSNTCTARLETVVARWPDIPVALMVVKLINRQSIDLLYIPYIRKFYLHYMKF